MVIYIFNFKTKIGNLSCLEYFFRDKNDLEKCHHTVKIEFQMVTGLHARTPKYLLLSVQIQVLPYAVTKGKILSWSPLLWHSVGHEKNPQKLHADSARYIQRKSLYNNVHSFKLCYSYGKCEIILYFCTWHAKDKVVLSSFSPSSSCRVAGTNVFLLFWAQRDVQEVDS